MESTNGTTDHGIPTPPPAAPIARRKSAVRRSVMDEYAQVRAERAEMERAKFKKAIASTTSAGGSSGAKGGVGGLVGMLPACLCL